MNRIRNIIGVVTGATINPGKFADLPLSAQTKVVFSCYNRVTSGMTWWNNVLNDESSQFSDNMRKRVFKKSAHVKLHRERCWTSSAVPRITVQARKLSSAMTS